jgi:hypothetical protein
MVIAGCGGGDDDHSEAPYGHGDADNTDPDILNVTGAWPGLAEKGLDGLLELTWKGGFYVHGGLNIRGTFEVSDGRITGAGTASGGQRLQLAATLTEDSLSGTLTAPDGTVTPFAAIRGGSALHVIMRSMDIFCMTSSQDRQYSVAGMVGDPDLNLASVTISGNGTAGHSPFTYNLYGRQDWWTDPNIFISQGTAPRFPLDYVVRLNFKDGTTYDVLRTVREAEVVD